MDGIQGNNESTIRATKGLSPAQLDSYLAECRELTLHELLEIIPKEPRYRGVLYDLMVDYPLRASKGLRPALCIATCRALGGRLESVLPSAAVLELYHNAFLIHDDVEDGSESRRERPTLHWSHGMPIAVNVGDAMLALALQPLLDNMALLGLGKSLRILQTVARMARESAEGQALELDWIRQRSRKQIDADYIRMVYKKTSWYTFIAPVLIGAIVAGAGAPQLRRLRRFATLLGIAFQIQDDILNLVDEGGAYGKEAAGDLWEGKHTLILMHALRTALPHERATAEAILAKPRPPSRRTNDQARESDAARLIGLVFRLEDEGEITAAGRAAMEQLLRSSTVETTVKTRDEIEWLLSLIHQCRSIDYARIIADRFARKAMRAVAEVEGLAPSIHRDLLCGVAEFVVSRTR